MPNTLLTINMITREAIRLFMNTNAFVQSVDRQYDSSFAVDGAKIGDSLRIRLPNDFTVNTGTAASIQSTTEQSTTLTLATQKNVAMSYSTSERTLKLDDYSRRIVAPAVNNLVGSVAMDIMSGVEGGVCNFVANQNGANAIVNPNAQTYLLAGASLALNSAPTQAHQVVNNPITEARVVASLSGLLNPSSEIGRQYNGGKMYDALGFEWSSDQTVLAHTTGTMASTTVDGADQEGLTLDVAAISGTVKAGDIITIDGVFAVNRVIKNSTGQLRQFVVTADAANGATSLSIYPAIVFSSSADYDPITGENSVQYQTVTDAPANGATVSPASSVTAGSTYRKNIAFSPEAVTMATADLVMPRGVHEAARDMFDGISMRMVTDYIFGTDQLATRMDILYGYLWIRPEWAVVVADAV